jgi:integrase
MNEGFDSPTRYNNSEAGSQPEFHEVPIKTGTNTGELTIALNQKKLSHMRMLSPYTTPKIYRGSNEWYVEFRYLNPLSHQYERFKIRGGLNYLKDVKRKEKYAVELQHEILKQLKAGMKPKKFCDIEIPEEEPPMIDRLKKIASKFATGKSRDTINGYALYIGRLEKYLKSINQEEIMLADFSVRMAQGFKDYMMAEMGLSNTSVNCTIQPLKQFFESVADDGEIAVNPFSKVKYLKKHRGTVFTPFTDEEKRVISDHLKKHHPKLYLFALMIYSCFIRPKELCDLKVHDIDLANGWIQVRMATSKVGHTSYRQIMPALKKVIEDLRIQDAPADSLVFGDICGHDSILRVRRRRITDLWKHAVKKKLGISKEMYGLKHTGNIDYLKNLDSITEANLMWLMKQNDHTSLDTTQIYLRDLGVFKIKQSAVSFDKF